MAQLPAGEPAPPDGSLPFSALNPDRDLSLYLHVPFCRVRCGYCDFNTYTPGELDLAPSTYLSAARREIELAARVLGPRRVTTVFVGGGTPTMLPAGELVGLLAWVAEHLELSPDAEITTEANPETLSPHYLAELRAGGFTRVSLGMQSAVPHVLATLERVHSPQRALHAAQWAHEVGFPHVSLDLIYGTPGESLADWRTSLDAVAGAPVDHISAYSLIVEEGTRLALQVRRGRIAPPDEDDLALKYEMAEDVLSGLGFGNYEVSNWAKPEGQCRHNLVYWRGGDWWGIGPGAHSHIGGVRFWNRKHPRSYAAELAVGRSPVQAREVLTKEQRHVEDVMLRLRLAEGIELASLTIKERARIHQLPPGLAEIIADRLVLSPAGRLLADGVVRDLLG